MFKLPFIKASLDVEKILRETPAGEMLVDSYDRVVGTPEVQGFRELVLYAHSDTQARLERYEDGGLESERMTAYLVPLSAVCDAYAAIRSAGMAGWNDRRNMTAICGMSYVCRFRREDGSYTRVNSGHMPADGTAAFQSVSAALRRYAREEYRLLP